MEAGRKRVSGSKSPHWSSLPAAAASGVCTVLRTDGGSLELSDLTFPKEALQRMFSGVLVLA